MTSPTRVETVTPSPAEAILALKTSERLASHKRKRRQSVRIQYDDDTFDVPAAAWRVLERLLQEMAKGNAVSLLATQAELTTQQVADLLNVSRPYAVKLLDEGKIPSRKVGRFRRAPLDQVLAYQERDAAARRATLMQLTADAQELGLGY